MHITGVIGGLCHITSTDEESSNFNSGRFLSQTSTYKLIVLFPNIRMHYAILFMQRANCTRRDGVQKCEWVFSGECYMCSNYNSSFFLSSRGNIKVKIRYLLSESACQKRFALHGHAWLNMCNTKTLAHNSSSFNTTFFDRSGCRLYL